jgi:lipopolysaccharide assembly outer membrane protein LptD (OstA)
MSDKSRMDIRFLTRPGRTTTVRARLPAPCSWLRPGRLRPALAEKADRSKPMNIEADALRHDDLQQTSVFTGRVVMTKGTIVLRGARLDVRQDAEGFQFGTVSAEPGSAPSSASGDVRRALPRSTSRARAKSSNTTAATTQCVSCAAPNCAAAWHGGQR